MAEKEFVGVEIKRSEIERYNSSLFAVGLHAVREKAKGRAIVLVDARVITDKLKLTFELLPAGQIDINNPPAGARFEVLEDIVNARETIKKGAVGIIGTDGPTTHIQFPREFTVGVPEGDPCNYDWDSFLEPEFASKVRLVVE